MVTISAILFKELQKRLVSCSDAVSLDQDVGLAEAHVYKKDTGEELLLLLRCCVLLVRLNPYDQILNEQFQIVVALLHKLSFQGTSCRQKRGSIRFSDPISSQSTYSCSNPPSPNDYAKLSDLSQRFILRMLEVYLDEVFADRPFRERIAVFDSVSSTYHSQSSCSSIRIEIVHENIAAHFLLSISEKYILQSFTKSLIWTEKTILSSPELSLHVAISLINHPVVMSAPTLLLAHLISLVSEAIGIYILPEVGPNVKCADIYLSTFYDSIILYYEHLSKLMTSSCISGRISQRPFGSHFQSEIYDKVNCVLLDLDNAWRAQRSCVFNKTMSCMKIDAISYIKMNLYIVDESCRDGVYFFLSSLMTRLLSVDINEVPLQSFGEMAMQDICLLASILKLISCSLLQATRCCGKKLSLITMLKRKDASFDYGSLVGLLNCFAKYNLQIPISIQQFLVDALKPHLSTYEELESLIMHFAGLLLVCIVSKLDILVKGCLFLLLVLMNALSLELGSSGFLRPSAALGADACSCTSGSFDDSQKSGARQESSLRIASNFQREKRKLLRDQTTSEVVNVSNEETCNGERYLKCFIDDQETIDELADFIVCKTWRNYSARVLSVTNRRHLRYRESTSRLQLAKFRNCRGKRKLKG